MTAGWAAAALLDALRAEVAGVLDDEHASRPYALEAAAAKLATVAAAFHTADDELADGEAIEPFCATCGAWIGNIYGLTEWRHFRGDPAPGGQRELYEAGHEAAPACPAQARTAGQALADAIAYRLGQAGGGCAGCGHGPAGACPGHVADAGRALAYRRLAAALARALPEIRGRSDDRPGRQAALITGLRAWTRGYDRHVRAAVELLIEHDVWLRRADFTRACIVRSGREASVNWVAARAFVGAGAVASTARPIWRCRMTKHDIAIEIDETKLASYTDTYLAMCWHIAQHNPAPHGDYFAGQLAERTGREIIRRWLNGTPPQLWRHRGRGNTQKELSRLAAYQPGDGHKRGASFGDDANMQVFHSGRWVPRPDPPGGQS